MKELMTEMIAKQPLASPGSDKYQWWAGITQQQFQVQSFCTALHNLQGKYWTHLLFSVCLKANFLCDIKSCLTH